MSQTPPETDVHLVRPAELSPEQISEWAAMQRDCRMLNSPFFHPQFTLAVGQVRRDAEVAVMEQDGRTIGFFPFHREGRTGRPIGLKLSDYHGVISRPEARWDTVQLVRACGLKHFQFNHMPAGQVPFREFCRVETESPFIDLESGWDAYVEERRRSGSKRLQSVARKKRKIEREIGALRFEFHTSDDTTFEKLIRWKLQQQERTGACQVLRSKWVVDLLDRIRSIEVEGFSGAMSALYCDGELAAAHLGMVGPDVLHMWFPVYNREFESYAPGLTHLMMMAQCCAERGIGRLDLGKGPEPYKESFRSGATPLIEGGVDLSRCGRMVSAASFYGREWLRKSPVRDAALATRKVARRYSYWRSST